MTEEIGFAQRWDAYRPSKTVWFWSCMGMIVFTVFVGFVGFGWRTGGSAERMAQSAADTARAQLVAEACIEKFRSSPNFAAELTALKDASAWKRSDMIEENGWVTLAGMKEPLGAAADLCARKLITMMLPQKENKDTSGS